MKSAFYGGLGKIEVLTPSPALLAEVHTAYVAMASSGLVTAPQRETLNAACTELIEDFGVDSVLLGGTDLALVYDEATSVFPVIDCAAIHALKIVSASSQHGYSEYCLWTAAADIALLYERLPLRELSLECLMPNTCQRPESDWGVFYNGFKLINSLCIPCRVKGKFWSRLAAMGSAANEVG